MKITIDGNEVEVLELHIVLVNKNIDCLYKQSESVAESILKNNGSARFLSRGQVNMMENENASISITLCDPSLSC